MALSDGTKFYSRWITTGVVLGILGFLGTFLFTKVTAIPETYPTKSELYTTEARIEKKVDSEMENVERQQSSLEKLVEQGFQAIQEAQKELHKDVREIRQKVQ